MAGDPLDYFALNIKVFEASDLPHSNISSMVSITVGTEKRHTKKIKNSDSPFYDESFIFDFYKTFADLMDVIITFSIFEPRKKLKAMKLIGSISLDVATVWAQPGHQLKKWLAVMLPSDATAQHRGFLKCEIRVEAAERYKLVPQLTPMESPNVIGGIRARYITRIHRCLGLEAVGLDKGKTYVFVKVLFAGISGKTTKRPIMDSIEWNEQLTFVELFPPLYQKITIELFVGKKKVVSKDFNLPEISDFSANGFLPTYGPTYVHLYINDCVYIASLLLCIEAEMVTSFKHKEKLHGVLMNPCQSCIQIHESFLCYGVLFDVVIAGDKHCGSSFNVSLSLGKVGRRPIKDNENNTITPNYTAILKGSQIVFLPIKENKPCVFVRSDWPDTRRRLFNSNMLARIVFRLKERVGYAYELVLKGSESEAKHMLLESLQTLKAECNDISGKVLYGETKLDFERAKLISNQLRHLASLNMRADDLESLFEKSNTFISVLNKISEDIQDSLPYVILSLRQGQNAIGYCKVHSREIIFSRSDVKKGCSCGRITSLFLQTPDKKIVGRLDIWLWLGYWNDVSFCMKRLPPKHKDISKAVSLPLTVNYTNDQLYALVCYIFGGYISGGTDREGLCNTYVRVLISNESQRTKSAKKSLAPLWKETLLFSDLRLYPSPTYIQDNPPFVTVELWDKSSTGTDVLMGSTLITPKVRLQPVSTTTEYNLQWIRLGLYSQILATFEIIQVTDMSNREREISTSKRKSLSKVMPQFKDPPTSSYRLEVIFWGVRSPNTNDFKGIDRLQIVIQLGTVEIKSNIMVYSINSPNFQHKLHVISLDLPNTKLYSPPLVLRLMAKNSSYVGYCIEQNVYKYLCHLQEKRHWKALSGYRQSVVERAQARHSSFRSTMPDLIPLIDINPDRRSSSLTTNMSDYKKKFMTLLSNLKSIFYTLPYFLRIIRSELSADPLEEEDEDEYDWWSKYFSAKLSIYSCTLENQQEFCGFNDVLQNFKMEQYTVTKSKMFIKVKALMCLYQWPVEEPLVTLQGQDPEMGVLNQTDINDRAKVLVRVYCIKAHNLHSADFDGNADPYIEIATPSSRVSDKTNYVPRQLNPIFGRCLQIIAEFPVDFLLTVRVMDWDRFTFHDLIGETTIDIENRFYSKHRATCGLANTYSQTGCDIWRDIEKPTEILERLCNTYNLPLPIYYEKSVLIASKEFVISKKAKSKEENEENCALMALHHWNEIPIIGKTLVPEHVETRSLFNKERPGIIQGTLEMWVDMFDLSLGQVPLPVNITPRKPRTYELRVIIFNTANIPLVDDSYFVGRKHTDIFVKGWLWDPDGAQSTDVHYTSINGNGNFNWRFIFPFSYLRPEKRMYIYNKGYLDLAQSEQKVPALLHLQVWDSDLLSANDFIGSMVMELCNMPRGARSKRTCKIKKILSPENLVDLFRVKHLRGWWPFLASKEGEEQTSAGFLEAEFHLLTEEEALSSPAGLGRSEPAALPPPLRPEFKTKFWLAPLRMIFHLVCGVHKGKFLLCLLGFGAIVFLLIAIYSVPIFIIKKIIGA